ncbi:hypothetical protein [Hydrogenimonas sp.]
MSPETLAKLKDIKPPVAVADTSWWWVAALAALLILAAAAWGWMKWRPKRRRRRRRKDPVAEARTRLEAIDYDDTKGAVYTFGEYLPLLIADDPALMEAFESLQKELEPYKYKKEVPPLSRAHRKQMERLVKKGVRRG